MKPEQKKLVDRLVWRMKAFLRAVKSENARMIIKASQLVLSHAKPGRHGPALSTGDINRLKKDATFDRASLLASAETLAKKNLHAAAIATAAVYELFDPEFAGILTARFDRYFDPFGDFGKSPRVMATKRLEQIAKDRRRTEAARRKAMMTLFEIGELRSAVLIAVDELKVALDQNDRYTTCELLLQLGEFGCYWSPEEEARRWKEEDQEARAREWDDDYRRSRQHWPI